MKRAMPDIVVCAVDDQIDGTRLFMSRWCFEHRVPGVFLGVTPDADGGYVFVQEPDVSCWECVMKSLSGAPTGSRAKRCPETPASVDILKTLSGIALYAIDTVLMARPRDWNYWTVSLSRSAYGGAVLAPRRPGCEICGDPDFLNPRGGPTP
ncbi:MAG: hypothetical protein JNK58_03385 [Phycisphaerae bacterium]|nr:hypothetical protein [Phycisphaerae bacterium]